jgi:hypothetical protein
MNTDIILELVETAVELAHSQLSGSDLTDTLADIALRGLDAYRDHTGEELNQSQISEEEEL